MRGPATSNRVLVYTSRAIPPQHRFIEHPLRKLRRWNPVVVCASRSPNTVPLDDLDIVCLDPKWPQRLHWLMRRLRAVMGRVTTRDIKRIRAVGGSILHSHWGTSGVLMAPLAKAVGLPLLVTLHGFDIQRKEDFWTSGQGGWWHRSYPDQLRSIAKDGAHFAAVSHAVRKLAIDRGIPEDQVHYLPIGVDTDFFQPGQLSMEQRPPKVLFVASHITRKGGDLLVQAMSLVRQSVPHAELVMVGDGPQRQHWESLAAKLGVTASFRGRLSPEGVVRELQDSVVFCLPSIRPAYDDLAEGFGLVVAEAGASGVPVVTSAQGVLSEGVDHGRTGFSVAEGDVDAIADGIVCLLSDRERAERFGRAGRDMVREKFDLVNCTATLEELYDKLASQS
jgi:glycosyltransferase involved in cell wall biosynthesis